jgi:hypothetical protein
MSYNVNNPPKSENINFIGKRVGAAKSAGVNWRTAKVDGESRFQTQDFNFSRYNFEVEHGVITKQWMG